MANQWLRLWHDMPTDPKWRTIARASGQPISLVQAVYLHLLVDASRNVTRGHATVTQEDLASALDVTEDAISSVLVAMQGRVLDEMRLLGWDARQPKREDSGDESTGAKSAAQRQAEKRERDRLATLNGDSHDESRNVTLDKDKEKTTTTSLRSVESASRATRKCPKSFEVTTDLQNWARAEAPGVDIARETDRFRDHTFKTAYTDWPGTWRNWIRKAADFGPKKTAHGGRYAAAAATIFGEQQTYHHGEVIDV